MAQDNTIRRRLTASYLTSVVSIALVLFMVGLVGMLLLNTKKLSDYVKENVGISIYLNDDIREVDVFSLQKLLDSKKYVKETRYITRETAAEGVVFALQAKHIYKALNELKKDTAYQKVKLSSKSALAGMERTQQVKKVEDYVFMVKVN